MRSSALAAAFIISLSSASASFAQDPPAQPPPTPAQAKPGQDPQKPPAAAGEEGKKPTRNFGSALIHNLGDDIKHLPRLNTVYFLAGGGALAAAVHPLDDNVNRHFEGTGGAQTFFGPGKWIGETPTIIGAGLASYIIGRTTNRPRAAHLGMDEIEGQIIAGAIVLGLKQSVRRERPLRADGTRATGFSFPSGHAAATFAGATVLQQHLGYKWGVPTYTVATYVALSRLHENVHNLSDVVFGATVGIVTGRTVTWHGRNFYASPMLVPKGSGIIVNVNVPSSLRHP